MVREFNYRGKPMSELNKISLEEFVELLPSQARRRINRKGFTEEQKKLLADLRKNKDEVVKTHCREMIIFPEMIGRKIGVYNGKEFVYVIVLPEMLGHVLGEYALTRRSVKHSGPGIGATRSTKFISVR
jgi:small subunit ribosomal protein S19